MRMRTQTVSSPTRSGRFWQPWTLGALAAMSWPGLATAQSDSALLNKLVEKGILTKAEADSLAKEAEKGFTKNYQTRSGMPDWVTSLKLKGDFRARAEVLEFDNPGVVDRTRFRYRLRFGAIATIKDDFEV